MEIARLLAGAVAQCAPRHSPYLRALEAWALAMDDAASAEAALGTLRERVRVARIHSADRARRAYDALAAGQEPFALGLLDAARAHEKVAWEGEAQILEGERQCATLRARCDDLDAEVRREGERQVVRAGAGAGCVDSWGGTAR
jgi:phage shock protein A